jgi:hypothetical protein
MSRHPESSRRSCYLRSAAFSAVCVAVCTALLVAGCGSPGSHVGGISSSSHLASGEQSTVSTAVSGSTEMVGGAERPGSGSAGPAVEDPSTGVAAGVRTVFVDLSKTLEPLPVYAPTILPPEAVLAAHWWPVTEGATASEHEGLNVDNPRIDSVDGKARSAQVVLQVGAGWLVFLENFRGDLGDVQGEEVGQVQGNRVLLYQVQGGTLAQWSDQGSWFALFGRDLDASVVRATALGCIRLGPSGELRE